MNELVDMMHTTNRYVCSRCWGLLVIVNNQIVCAKTTNGKCNGAGYVTKRFAEKRRSESIGELLEVRQNYPNLCAKQMSAGEKLKALGF